MRARWMALTVVVLCLGTFVSVADDHEGGGQAEGMPPMGPPAEIKQIEMLVGKYKVKFAYKVNPMGEEWTETEANAEISMVAGGSAQQLTFEGNMMGMPFTGLGLTTFDRETKEWQTNWVDSMAARLSMYTGSLKEGKMVVTGKDLGQGQVYHSRLTTYNMTDKGFDWKYEVSMDGTNYMETAKATYVKQ